MLLCVIWNLYYKICPTILVQKLKTHTHTHSQHWHQ